LSLAGNLSTKYMEKDSLKKSYQNRNNGNKDVVGYFTGGSSGDFLKNLKEKDAVKPQPQAKPQPNEVEAAPKKDPERDALLSEFNEKKKDNRPIQNQSYVKKNLVISFDPCKRQVKTTESGFGKLWI
jgi:hypothetical protein